MTTEAEQIKEILNVHLGYLNERFDKLEDQIGELKSAGCERGRVNAKAIADIQTAQKGAAQRAGAAAGGLIAVIGGVVTILIEYFRRGAGQ